VKIDSINKDGNIISGPHIKLEETLILLSFVKPKVLCNQLLSTFTEESIPEKSLVMHGKGQIGLKIEILS